MKKFTIEQLVKKYGISRPAIYKRIKASQVEINKEGNRSYLSAENVEILDELDEYLKKGGNMATFVPTSKTIIHQDNTVNSALNTVITEEIVKSELNSVKEVVIKVYNPIDHWEKLEKAEKSNYYLTTKEVKELVGTSPRGNKWIRGSFKFIKIGKIGNQAAWKIERC